MGVPSRQASGPIKVVAAFADGRRVHAFVFAFSPLRDKCNIFMSEGAHGEEAQEVDMRQLKAIFFVRKFADLEVHGKTHTDEFVGAGHG